MVKRLPYVQALSPSEGLYCGRYNLPRMGACTFFVPAPRDTGQNTDCFSLLGIWAICTAGRCRGLPFFASTKVLHFFELCKSLQHRTPELAANDMSLNYFTIGKNLETVRAIIEDMPMETVCRVTPDGLLRGRERRLACRVSE